jgi:serine/threonine protein kinase
MRPDRWTTVTDSSFPWEREALEFLREHLPDHEPWRAWSNFEFIDDQGRVNEVDLLVLGPRGLILVEIKSRPGTVEGDAHSWVWNNEGRRYTVDNPVLLANRKAKRLASLVRRQDALVKSKGRAPFIVEAVFLSRVRPPLRLPSSLLERVFLRGRPGQENDNGIVGALTGGLDEAFPRGTFIDASSARTISRAIQQAGIRPSLRDRRIGDYELHEVIGEGEGFQDFAAIHVSQGTRRRVRLYAYAQAASKEARERLMRSAEREFQLLEGIDHPNILRVLDYRDTDRGPALIFEHDPEALRLDHFVRERGTQLGAMVRLDILRQIAEALQYAHEKRLYHRSLSPACVLVSDPLTERPRVKIMNWQTAARTDSAIPTAQRTLGTSHIDEYLVDPARVYVAPEAREGLGASGPHHDVFSLGALGYFLFTLTPPAPSSLELPEKLRRQGGLRISQVIDGVGGDLDDLIQLSTAPDVGRRIGTVQEFLAYLSDAERELNPAPTDDTVEPGEAKPGDKLSHGLILKERLGSGGSSEALLVTREGDNVELVLKIARDAGHNDRLRAEADTLQRLHHPNIVRHIANLEFAGRAAILMERAGKHTLGWHIRSPDPPSLDLARRFGEELLEAIRYLDDQGVQHRDIKPDNIGIADAPGSGRKRLVLFDFSLSRTAPENIEAGTRPYLDPFLQLRRPPRWDLYAERFAAAVTLYEMLTGHVPEWGDGLSDPAVLDEEANIEADRFDPALRDGLHRFFDRALRREPTERFGNVEDMLRDWRAAFAVLDRRPDTPESLELIARRILADTSVAELGYGIEARDVLDKMGIHTVAQLLATDRRRFRWLRNVGERIRKEIRLKAKHLTRLRPDLIPGGADDSALAGRASIDQLYDQLLRQTPGIDDSTEDRVLATYLGIDEGEGLSPLPNVGQVAKTCGIARSAVTAAIEHGRERWHRSRDLNQVREDIGAVLSESGGVMTVAELADALLAARGSMENDLGERRRLAFAVLRAATELEGAMSEPRFALHSGTQPPLIATDDELIAYARRLGEAADQLTRQDPLPSADRGLKVLRQAVTEIQSDHIRSVPETRMLRLAAAASAGAALSARLELYPRGMAADKALRLSVGSLLGVRRLTVEQIRERVRGRYPDAEQIPDRPALDVLLEAVGAERVWRDDAEDGPGYYVQGLTRRSTGTLGSRLETTGASPEPTPEILAARDLEAKLKHAHGGGGYLVVTAQSRDLLRAEAELLRRFPRTRISIDRLLIDLMRAKAETLGISWKKVLEADGTGYDGRDFSKLLELVRRIGPDLERELMHETRRALLVHPGLLSRYGQLALLDKLRNAAGSRRGPPSLWLLVPQETAGLPMLDGHPIPVLSSAEWVHLNEAWLVNAHRAGTAAA